ncbi:glutamate 5-kinase [Marinospirillum insulare]|uniref:Glutamate 5-kinase n=1 Tax=Marinospirillum insulare TaxID=217169 RepID=A0ABQ5ZY58_9GAMM|nr:glutamate 5-kinase [Marinospirillum insulare]GLR65140.1 glutamate 5-kinase [Marinospirillum insulare]
MLNERQTLTQSSRVVVKIGSALLTNDGQGLDVAAIEGWVAQMAKLKEQGRELLLVTSGSVAEGMVRLGWKQRPKSVHELQAAAAVGQMGLIQTWETAFKKYGIKSAQILLTHDDLSNRKRYLNARSALRTLVDLGVVPIINENDTVATDEIRFGDNDTLGALVTNLLEVETLVLLTDQDGLFDADPRENPKANLISEGRAQDPALLAVAGDGGALGRGGMFTKVRAARLAARSGARTVILGGRTEQALTRLFEGEKLGTLLLPDDEPITARKRWLAGHLQEKGVLVLDKGASQAVQQQGKSLLPVGVKEVRGRFARGELVVCIDDSEQRLAKGLINYSSNEASLLAGQPSHQIERILGYVEATELIHRDNLVVIK